MLSDKNEVPPPPGFSEPLAKILPIDDQSKGERSVKRRSPRKRTTPDLFVPTHSRPSPRPRGPGLRRGRGRPRKQRSPDVTEAPAVSPPPASPLGLTGDSPLVSAITNTPEAVAPTPLGSVCEEDTKSSVKSSTVLMHPPKTNHKPKILDEESKKVILNVESLLVKNLLTSENDVNNMVHQANATFTYLEVFGVDYASFYREVTEYISHRRNLLDAERDETMWSLSALQEKYENAIITANAVDEDFGRTLGEEEKAKRQIKDLKQELAHIKHKKERLKEAREAAKAKEQELGNQLEAAQANRTEIHQRKNAALVGIESATRRLKSTYHIDFD